MKETARAREAYTLYRDMGPARSTAKVARTLGKCKRLIDKWSGAHGWVKRVDEWDTLIDRRADERTAQRAADDRVRRHETRLKVYEAARGVGVQSLRLLAPEDVAQHAADVIRLLSYADEGERLDAGEATQRQEIGGTEGAPAVFTIHIDRAGGAPAPDQEPEPPS